MPDEKPTPKSRAFEPGEIESELFRLISERYPALVPLDELIREYRFPPDCHRDAPAIFVSEAVERLYHDGLVHRIEGFVFATRAGVRALELWA